MSVEMKILEYLSKKKSIIKYKGVRTGFLGLPNFEYYKYQTLANRFSILSKNGLIRKMPNGEYLITSKGISFLESKKYFLEKFDTNKKIDSPKDLLIVYDIEEGRKKERNWFRYHLKKFHFVMIQKSVWVGPSPLPRDFQDYLKEIKLGDNFKIFKLSSDYKIKK